MKTIAISFSLKDQDVNAIFQRLEELAVLHPNVLLVHGFLPREEVVKKELSTEVVDRLKELFPVQLNLWNEVPLREEMAEVVSKLEGKVYVIGEVKDGVAEEVALYRQKNLEIIEHVL